MVIVLLSRIYIYLTYVATSPLAPSDKVCYVCVCVCEAAKWPWVATQLLQHVSLDLR